MSGHARIRMLNAVLAAATLALVCSTLYFAQALRRERQVAAPSLAAGTGQLPAGMNEAVTSVAAPPAPPAPPAPASAPANVVDRHAMAQRDPVDVAVARYLVKRHADKRWRALQAAQLRDVLREDWEFLGSSAGLSSQEVSQIIERAVEMNLAEEQRRHACEADEACEPAADEEHEVARTDRAVLQMVGPEKLARIQALREADRELRFTRVLRRLPENGELSDTDAGRLALAMAEVRQRLQRDVLQSGGVLGVSSEPFPLYFVRLANPGGRPADTEQMLAAAVAYNARVRARAAAILDGALLARFEALQEVNLDIHRRRLREQQVTEAARAR